MNHAQRHGFCVALVAVVIGTAIPSPAASVTDVMRSRVAFEANHGQTDERVKFLARVGTYTLFLTPTQAVMVARDRGEERATVRMSLVGANGASDVVGVDQLPGRVNYFKRDARPTRVTDVPMYAAVKYVGVYPGVDLVYYARQGQVEYDFVLAPGADPNVITLAFEGADRLEVDAQNDLIVHTAAGELRQLRPAIYQEVDGVRRQVPGTYVLRGPREVGIEVGTYDPSHALVIDPVLVYATYLGGSNDDGASRIAVDAGGNAYVVGTTASLDFPTTPGTDRTLGGDQDAFVAKFSPSGALLYATYLGGPCDDAGLGIAIDGAGNAYVTGRTNGLCTSNLPSGVLVAKLNSTGGLIYSFTFGGSLADTSRGHAIAVDAGGNAYVTGTAQASTRDFPTTPNAYRTTDCNGFLADGFVAKVNPSGTGFVYSTFLCGTANDSPNAIAVDAAGNAYVAGSTDSHDFPVVNAFQPTHNGGPAGTTGFVAKLDSTGSNLVYSTYLGGTFGDVVNGIAVDGQGNAYVTGETTGGDFPTTAGVVQPKAPFPICFIEICADAFVAKFSPTGSRIYSTFLAGGLNDSGGAIAVDATGNVYVAGSTNALEFPIRDAFQTVNRGLDDAFIVKLNPDATRILFSSYLGGGKRPNSTAITEGSDSAHGIAIDSAGNVYVAGYTTSLNFPTTAGAFQPNPGGGTCFLTFEPCGDAFVAKITAGGPGVVPTIHLDVTPTEVAPAGTITATWGGIPTPTTSDQLVLFALGERSNDVNALATFATGGTATGTLALPLPATLTPATYELRLMSPDPNSPAILSVIARSAPLYVVNGGGGGAVSLVVTGNPATGPYAVEAQTSLAGPLTVKFFVDGSFFHQESAAAYCLFGGDGPCLTGTLGMGAHVIKAQVFQQGGSTVLAEAQISVTEGSTSAPLTLVVTGNPATGPYAVEAQTTLAGSLTVQFSVDGSFFHQESVAAYCLFGGDGPCLTGTLGTGAHVIKAQVFQQGGTTVLAEAQISVTEGSPSASLTLVVTGNPATGPYAVEARTTLAGPLTVQFSVDGSFFHQESVAAYCLFGGDGPCLTGTLGTGAHVIKAQASAQGSSTILAEAQITVRE